VTSPVLPIEVVGAWTVGRQPFGRQYEARLWMDARPSVTIRDEGESPMTKVTPFLMFNDQLEAAMEFYTATFPDSEIRNVARTGKDGPITSAEFLVGGQVFMGYNGGPYFSFSEGFSLYVDCEDQAEVDEYWDKLVKAGAKPTQCGWIKDPFGLSWQIVPRRFIELIRDKDARRVEAVMEAMMTMVKLDVAALERAYNEA
jgi:predicted 3-demethylubiquinone-9 3-methyltransferase (glyoxalase superfamily)